MVKKREATAETRFARRLRTHQTPAEIRVWNMLRRKQLFGLKFRRQHPIAGFVVDFFCPQLKLVLELEGGIHSSPGRPERDRRRADTLRALGLRVFRLANEDATEDNLRRLVSAVLGTR